MAKPLVFQFKGSELPMAMCKVDRSGLYGFIETEVLDEKGRVCTTCALAGDGQTVIGSGGSAFATLSHDGRWLEKAKLSPVDREGKKLTPVPSSFGAPIELGKTASIDEYLSHSIRAIYQLNCEGDLGPLRAELKKGTIYSFPYSYRGGLSPDAGFLLQGADGNIFLAVGTPCKIEFIGLAQPAAVVDEEGAAEEEGDEIDFGMM
jgi:hypothetical protein